MKSACVVVVVVVMLFVVVGRREVEVGGLSGPYRRWWNCDDAERIAGWCGVRLLVPRGEPK